MSNVIFVVCCHITGSLPDPMCVWILMILRLY